MYKLLPIIFVVFLIGCSTNQKDQIGDLYMCICTIDRTEKTDDGRKIQDKYIFLLNSVDQPDCCTESANTNYTGWHEIWKEDDLNYPGVWSRQDDDKFKIDAFEAQQKGCDGEDGMKQISNLSKFPMTAMYSYPEIAGPIPQQ